MRQKSNATPASSETLVRNIRRATRKHHAAEEKIRIVLDGLRGVTRHKSERAISGSCYHVTVSITGAPITRSLILGIP